ncbi:hypothetical protein BIY29_12870 [Brenneria alni]|uniref:Cadherin domain-containing protein n=1 Tax=Brenneria alni TaxID=71656 RepID=A0A421DM55_9GAMM|nr:putative Ig domain-containing protein [Brenneria alni]RLM21937.1 hypothetical protein BIY29_12870 [Brenneria alni]
MTFSRSKAGSAPQRIPRQAWVLEPRMMFDAAAVATVADVAVQVAPTDSAPGASATPVAATVTITDSSDSFPAVDLFSNVSVSPDTGGGELQELVITVDSSGGNQALIIDGSVITLTTATGNTKTNNYFYSVAVSGNVTTITVNIASSDTGYTAEGAAALIDGISYQAQDKSVESGEVSVTLTTLSDDSDSASLNISATITIDSQINVAPVLSGDSALEAAESFTADELGGSTEVAYSSDGSYAYVAGDGVLSVFSVDDSGRLALLQTLAVDNLGAVSHMVTSSDGLSVYATDGSSNIFVLDVNEDGTLRYVSTIDTNNGNVTGGLAISQDGAWVYVGTEWNGMVIYSRDAASSALNHAGRVDDGSRDGVIATAGDYVYAIYSGAGLFGSVSLSVYQRNDDGSLTTITSVTVSDLNLDFSNIDWSNPNYTNNVSTVTLAVSADGQYLYIAAPLKGVVFVYQFSGGNLTQLDSVAISGVSSITLNDEDGLLYAVSGDGAISVYSVAGNGGLIFSSSIAGNTSGSDIAVSGDGLSILAAGGSVSRYTSAQTLNLGEALTFASGLTLKDSNYDVLNGGEGDYNGASITVSASVDGGSFGFADGNGLTLENGVISLGDDAIAALSVSDGVLTVTFTDVATRAVANQVLQQLSYTNASVAMGSLLTLTVRGRDSGAGNLSSNDITLTLRANAVPQVNTDAATGYGLSSATSETAYRFTLFSGLFHDEDGDTLTWSVSGLPDGLTFDATTRTIAGTTAETGTFTVTVSATDPSGASASLALDLVVEQVANRAPEINPQAAATLDSAVENTAYSVTLDASLFNDADSRYGDSLSWSVSGLPDGLTFDAGTLTLSGAAATLGSYTVTVTVTDQSGASASTELTLRVITQSEADNSAPVLDVDESGLVYTAEGNLTGFSQYVYGLALSPDDGTLMVLGSGSNSHAITPSGNSTLYVYSRDADTGELTLVQTFVQGAADDGDDSNGIEINGLDSATSAVYSADGKYAYLVGKNASGNYVVTVFSVNDNGTLGVTGLSAEVTGASEIKQLTVSADGGALYVISSSTLYAYTVGENGALNLSGSYSDSYSTASAMAIDSSGNVYVLGGSKLIVYTANGDGTLTYATTGTGIGLSGTSRGIVVSDAGYIYATTGSNNTVVTLYYDSATNTVTRTSTASPGSQVWGLSLSQDGTALYAGGLTGQVYIYSVNGDGSLTHTNTLALSTNGRAFRYAISSDNTSIYVGGFYNRAGLSLISAGAVSGAYTEGETTNPAASVSLSDVDYDALADGAGNYNGATITLMREGGANSADSYSFSDGNGLTLADGVLSLNGAAIGTFASDNGALTIRFTADVTTVTANQVLQQIGYANTSSDPGSRVMLTLAVGDEYTTSSVNILLTVDEINNAPSLVSTAGDVTYTSGGNAVKLFSDTRISAGEVDQLISELTLTVSGVVDGESETLTIDGTAIALVAGSGTTTRGYRYTVTVEDNAVTVTLTGSEGIAANTAEALVNGIGYANHSDEPTISSRTVTLKTIKDNGGTNNNGVDTTALTISANVTLSLTNHAPSLSSTAASTTYVENADASNLFSNTVLSTGEDGQAIRSLTLTVAGLADGENETLIIDGISIVLVEGISGTTTSGYGYTVSVAEGTATVILNSVDGIAVGAAAALIDAIGYVNTSDDPTATARTVTLAAIQDDGGASNNGTDIATLAIAATVNVIAVNDAPGVVSSAVSGIYTESGSSISLFSDTAISTVEDGQGIIGLTLTVSGVVDGGSEILEIDGATIRLVAGSGATDSGYRYTVTVEGDTVTVAIDNSGSIDVSTAAALVDSINYLNLSTAFTAGDRTFTLSVQDNGGTENGGSDITTLAGSTIVTLVENTAPVLGSTPDNETLEVIQSLPAIEGITAIAATALSGDGSHLYVVASDGAVATFSRNASTGELIYQGSIVSGVTTVSDIQISDDGARLYILGEGGDAIAIFSRTTSDGSLSLTQTLATENVVDLGISSDGGAIYVVDGNYAGLSVYTLDSESGLYALTQQIAASTSTEPYLFTGVGIKAVGDYVFVITDPAASTVADTLIVYQRGSDGALNAISYLRDGADDSAGTMVEMSSPIDITVSSDGQSVYVASADGVSIFSFDADSGTLSVAGHIAGLSNVTGVALAGDNHTLYVTSSDGTLSRYDISASTPVLLQVLTSDTDSGLSGARHISVSSNGMAVVTGAGGLVNLRDGLAASLDLAYTEQSTILLAQILTLTDADYDALNNGSGNYAEATIAIARADGISSDDSYGFMDGNGLTLVDGTLYLNDAAIGAFVSRDGALTVTFSADVTTATANLVLQQITYTNNSNDPGSSIALVLTVSDAYTSDSVRLALAVNEVNNAPSLTTTGMTAAYTEDGAPASLFSATALSTVEAGQEIVGLTLTVSGLTDGASETLTVDGTVIALVAGSGATASGYGYTVTVTGDTATVVLSSVDGIETSAAAGLIDAITYANASDDPTTGTRTVTLTAVQDSGGVQNGGSDITALNIAATVTVAAVNDAPVVSASASNSDYTGSAISLFSNTHIDTVEADDRILAVTLSVAGVVDGVNEVLNIDGSSITLTDGASVTTGNGYLVSVSVNADGVTTVTIASGAGITADLAAALINSISYQNAAASGGDRVITLIAVQDSGGKDGAGRDTVNLAISATVSVNFVPEITATDYRLNQATENEAYSVTLPDNLFTDADGDTLTWRLDGLPDGLIFDADTRTISGTPTESGTFSLTISVQDSAGGRATLTLTLTVGREMTFNNLMLFARPGDAFAPDNTDREDEGGLNERVFASSRPTGSLLRAAIPAVTADAAETQRQRAAEWGLEPVMTTLLPALETVNFSSRDQGTLVSDTRSTLFQTIRGQTTALESAFSSLQGTLQPDNAGALVFTLPQHIFSTREGGAVLTLQLANGRPLPSWVQFDARSGVVRITDASALQVNQIQLSLTAQTADGSSRTLPITLRVGQGVEPPVPLTQLYETEAAATSLSVQRLTSDPAEVAHSAGKAAFSQQLEARRNIDELLNALDQLTGSVS